MPSGLKATQNTTLVWPVRLARSFPVATFHSLMVRSLLPEASILLFGLKATEVTQSMCPLRVVSSLPVVASHSLTVASLLPEASQLPSRLKATEDTESACPLRLARSLPVRTSQSLILWSRLPDARVSLSGLKATDNSWSPCSVRVACSLGSCAGRGGSSPNQATHGHTRPSTRGTFVFTYISRGAGHSFACARPPPVYPVPAEFARQLSKRRGRTPSPFAVLRFQVLKAF